MTNPNRQSRIERRHSVTRAMRHRKSLAGFTIIEAVMVILITGIIAAVVATFIRLPVQGYLDSTVRADLTDVADTALRRMARDIRLALPNSIRTATDGSGNPYIEFLMTNDGGRYLADEDNPTGGIPLRFGTSTNCTTTPSDCQFSAIPPVPVMTAGSNYVVVYNQNQADAYTGTNRALITGVAGTTVTFAANALGHSPFGDQNPGMRSPSMRFHVVTTPVSFGCANNTLTRYSGYPIAAAQSTPPAGAGLQTAVLASGTVLTCSFTSGNMANQQSGLVELSITIQDKNSESVTLVQQVHVDNTP